MKTGSTRIDDPAEGLLDSRFRAEQALAAAMDPQEERERLAAARAYAAEQERHFVDYAMDCVDYSVKANQPARESMSDLYRMYQEQEPASYKNKESWMSRVVIPKPNSTVQFGSAVIKRAFTPNFLDVECPGNEKAQNFWGQVMRKSLGKGVSDFPSRFRDACIMALAVGQSMEMIPMIIPGKGLYFELVEPWKIIRDPDARPRDPWSGMYWIHAEWIDWWVLRRGEKDGKYTGTDKLKYLCDRPEDVQLTEEQSKARRNQVWHRARFRTMIHVYDVWGTVLDPRGEMLLPRARYTVAGGHVIREPEAVPYETIPWPGIYFSPMPDLLKAGGRGLLEGTKSIWEAWCDLMCLHVDALNWIVNPPTEINVDALQDPDDVEDWPGKKYLTRNTVHGNQAVRAQLRRDTTNSVLANSAHLDGMFQRGSMVTDAVQGLPGYRQDMTWRESRQNLEMSMGVFGVQGDNVEYGARCAALAALEAMKAFATYQDYERLFDRPEDLAALGVSRGGDPDKNAIDGLPPMSGNLNITGITKMLQEADTLKNIMSTVIPLAGHPRFAPYIKPWMVVRVIERVLNMVEDGVFANTDEAKQITQAEIQRAEQQANEAKRQQQIEDLSKLGPVLKDLAELMGGKNDGDGSGPTG